VRARLVLLDALEALGEHRSSLILVGAQAVYVHAGEATFGMVTYTTDADLAIDPRTLQQTPPIGSVMRKAGFRPGSSARHLAGNQWHPGRLSGARGRRRRRQTKCET
jgi:hypothetical protein